MAPKFAKACEPFLTWLKNADEESDEEEGDENESPVASPEAAAIPQIDQKVGKIVESDDELDIDAI